MEQDILKAKHDRCRFHEWKHDGENVRQIDCVFKGIGQCSDKDEWDSPQLGGSLTRRMLRKPDFYRCSEEEFKYWVSCFEKHCRDNKNLESEKLQVAHQSLQGSTGNWIKNLWEKNPPNCWK